MSLVIEAEPSELPRALSLLETTFRTVPNPVATSYAAHAQSFQRRRDRLSLEHSVIRHLRAHVMGEPLPTREGPQPGSDVDIPGTQLRLWRPSNSALVVAGDFDVDSVRSVARAQFGALKPAAASGSHERTAGNLAVVSGEPGVGSVVFVPTQTGLVELSFGFFLPAATDRDRTAAELLTAMLGNGVSSLLNRGLRERLGLTYSVQTALETRSGGCMLYGVLAVTPSTLREALRGLRTAFGDLRARALPDALERARARLPSQRRLAREHVGAAAETLVNAFVTRQPAGHAREPLPDDVSADALRALAERYLDRQNTWCAQRSASSCALGAGSAHNSESVTWFDKTADTRIPPGGRGSAPNSAST